MLRSRRAIDLTSVTETEGILEEVDYRAKRPDVGH